MGRILILALGTYLAVMAPRLAGAPAAASAAEYAAVERFLVDIEKSPVSYHARRHLEAASPKLEESAWLKVDTEYSPETGFNYRIAEQGGSERILKRVLRSVLEAEKTSADLERWRSGAISKANYDFSFDGRTPEGLIRVNLIPKRRDVRLMNGAALLQPDSGGLTRLEGKLSKSPSFWVRSVQLTRRYSHIGGAVMPVAVESTADVKIAGESTFSMTYEYEMVNGQKIESSKVSRVPGF
jgi:hypothetical protein